MHIIAHRGGAQGVKENENRLKTIEKSLSLNVDLIEVDLRMKGEQIVLSHDPLVNEKQYDKLIDLLKLVEGKKPLNLEIKEYEVIEPLVGILKKYSGNVLLSSKKNKVLVGCREFLPGYELAVVEKWSGVRGGHRARKLNTKRIHMNKLWLWSGFIKALRHSGYELYAYTVNSEKTAEKLKKAGISGIFTDNPKRFF